MKRILTAILVSLLTLTAFPAVVAGAPVLQVTGITNGGAYDADDLPAIEVSATGDNVVKLEFYVGNVLCSTIAGSSASYDLTDIGVGAHSLRWRAYDEAGVVGLSGFFNVTVRKTATERYENDFSDYVSGNPFGGANNPQAGYYGSSVINPDYGTSFLLGINSPPISGQNDGAWVGLPLEGISSGRASMDFDFYISERPAADKHYNFNFDGRGQSAVGGPTSPHNLAYIRESRIDVFPNADAGGGPLGTSQTFNYEIQTWYHMKVEVDMDAKKFAVVITDAETESVKLNLTNGAFRTNEVWLQNMRIFTPAPSTPAESTVATFMAMSNVVIDTEKQVPRVSTVGTVTDGGYGGGVNSDVSTFRVKLGSEAHSVSAARVSLISEFGEVPISRVRTVSATEYDVTVRGKLESNTSYRIVFDKSAEIQPGVPFGINSSGVFTTNPAALDLTSASYNSTGSEFTAYVLNTTGESVDVYIIANIYNGDKIVRTKAQKTTVASGDVSVEAVVSIGSLSAGEYVKTSVVAGFSSNTPVVLSKKAYRYR